MGTLWGTIPQWARVLLAVLGIAFTLGMGWARIAINQQDIRDLEENQKCLQTEVSTLQLSFNGMKEDLDDVKRGVNALCRNLLGVDWELYD